MALDPIITLTKWLRRSDILARLAAFVCRRRAARR